MKTTIRMGLMMGIVLVIGASAWAMNVASLRDRTPVAPLPERKAAVEEKVATEPKTVEERLEVIERVVRRLERSVDPYGHQDEMRLENRIRELERTVQRLEQELRRVEAAQRR